MPLLCGCPNAGPRASSNCTDAANDTCSTSVRLAHQPPNSSVYSTSQAMHEYSLRGIFRQVHFLDATLPHTTRKRATGYNYNVEGQKSAPSREVIRFILYLSIHLPDTRSTFQSQRVFFIEDATLSGPKIPCLPQGSDNSHRVLCAKRRKDSAPFETKSLIHLVGVKGFEPSTPCTPCKCATRLRHTPIEPAIIARARVVSL